MDSVIMDFVWIAFAALLFIALYVVPVAGFAAGGVILWKMPQKRRVGFVVLGVSAVYLLFVILYRAGVIRLFGM